MSAKPRDRNPPPLFLALVHLLVFGGAACVSLEIAYPEWRQLFDQLFHPYVLGEPPQPMALVGSGACAILLLALIARVALRRTVPLGLSVAILAFAGLTFWPAPLPEHRSWARVDTAILDTLTRLQRQMVQTLQDEGQVPTDEVAWKRALMLAVRTPLPVRAHLTSLEYTLVWVPWGAELPEPRVPGTVVARVSTDGAAFAVNAVGVDAEGRVSYLKDDRGELLTLRGLFNPSHPTGGAPLGAAELPSGGF